MDAERRLSRIFPGGFTLSEVLICVVVILVLATLAIAGYTQVMDNAYQRVCATNQTIIMKGIERHFLTTGIAPATLGDINIEHWKDAYAQVMQDSGWQTKLSYFLVRISAGKEAWAAITKLEHLVTPSEMRVCGIMADVFRCPADRTPESPSYGINTDLKNYDRWSNVSEDMSLIADCDSYTFSSEDTLCYRHKRKFGQEEIAQAMTKLGHGKKHKKDKGEGKDKDKDKEKDKPEKKGKTDPGNSALSANTNTDTDTGNDEALKQKRQRARCLWNKFFNFSLDDIGKNAALAQIEQKIAQIERDYVTIQADIKHAQERIDFWNSQRDTFLGALGRLLSGGKNKYIDEQVAEWEGKLREAQQRAAANRQDAAELGELQQLCNEIL